jgi:hypothetical protein
MARIGHLLTRPVSRPPTKARVFFASFAYQAQNWSNRAVSWPRSSGTRVNSTGASASSSPTSKRSAERVVRRLTCQAMDAIANTVKLNLRIPEPTQRALEQAAAEDERSVSWCVPKAIEMWLAARKAQSQP